MTSKGYNKDEGKIIDYDLEWGKLRGNVSKYDNYLIGVINLEMEFKRLDKLDESGSSGNGIVMLDILNS